MYIKRLLARLLLPKIYQVEQRDPGESGVVVYTSTDIEDCIRFMRNNQDFQSGCLWYWALQEEVLFSENPLDGRFLGFYNIDGTKYIEEE